jgi:glycosyltransferase involved in cell wall biosynthesis
MTMSAAIPKPMGQTIDQSLAPTDESADLDNLPKITVVTPSFNQAKYLQQTIKSVLAQGYPNLEWLVVDGGSKDDSVDVIKQYQQHFAWWVSEKDKGHPDALNKGYSRATGEIFCFVNSDDLLEPGALRYVGRTFRDKPQTNWVVGWAKYFDNANDEWVYGPQPTDRPIDFFLHNPIPQISSFWRTSAFKTAGPFRLKYPWAFDYDYWMRLRFISQWKPVQVRRCLGAFRLHMESKTCSAPQTYGPENAALREEYAQYLTPAEAKQWRKEARQEQKSRSLLDVWEALKQKDIPAARRLALKQVMGGGWSAESWKVLACALRGY